MNVLQSIILGFIQGVTEFLPISSSGHLVLAAHFFHWNIPAKEAFYFNILVQSATLLAVFIYFWQDLIQIIKAFLADLFSGHTKKSKESILGWQILISTMITGILGFFLKDYVEKAFSSAKMVGGFLFVTASLLFIAEKIGRRNQTIYNIGWRDAIWIGLFQTIAIFPGVSRSGATISGGLTKNLNREEATRYSFLISIPIMLLASMATIIDITDVHEFLSYIPIFIPGFITAIITGYISIRWLLNYLKHNTLYPFIFYCLVLGAIVLMTT